MFYCVSQTHKADRCALLGDVKGVERAHLLSSIVPCVIQAIVVGGCFYLEIPFVEQILAVIPEWITRGMSVAGGILPALGFAMLAKMIIAKEIMGYLLIGFLLSAYLKIDTTGVALLGLGVALLIVYAKNSTEKVGVFIDENEF